MHYCISSSDINHNSFHAWYDTMSVCILRFLSLLIIQTWFLSFAPRFSVTFVKTHLCFSRSIALLLATQIFHIKILWKKKGEEILFFFF